MAYIGEGRRKGTVLTYRGNIYHKNKLTNNAIYWRCSDKGCRAPLKSNLVDIDNPPARIRILSVGNHTCQVNDEEVQKLKIVNF